MPRSDRGAETASACSARLMDWTTFIIQCRSPCQTQFLAQTTIIFVCNVSQNTELQCWQRSVSLDVKKTNSETSCLLFVIKVLRTRPVMLYFYSRPIKTNRLLFWLACFGVAFNKENVVIKAANDVINFQHFCKWRILARQTTGVNEAIKISISLICIVLELI